MLGLNQKHGNYWNPASIFEFRVAVIFCESRLSVMIDQDDVYQAARILLPGADFPPRSQAYSDQHASFPEIGCSEVDYVDIVNMNAAFNMLLSGRRELIPHALQILPPSKVHGNYIWKRYFLFNFLFYFMKNFLSQSVAKHCFVYLILPCICISLFVLCFHHILSNISN